MAALIMESAEVGAGFSEPLAQKLAKGALPVLDCLDIASDIAAALRELHQKGLIHGDVRAESVWVGAEGATLAARGTRCQMADPKVDVTAFGSLLYEIFAGYKLPEALTPPAYRPVTVPASLDDVRLDAMRLGERCHAAQLDSKQALIELRILTLQTRRLVAVNGPAADVPASHVPEPEAEPEFLSARETEHAFVCHRCMRECTPSRVRPRSLMERILRSIGPLRECEVCGFRFVVIRIRRAG